MRTRLWVLPFMLLGLGLAPSGSSSDVVPAATGGGQGKKAQVVPAHGKQFDPAAAWLGQDSAERRALAAMSESDWSAARAIGAAALPHAEPLSRGRLLWLLARVEAATDNTLGRQARLGELYQSDHPLSRWAGVLLAESLKKKSPAQAASIAHGLTRGWAGAARARRVEALALYRAGEAAEAETRLRALLEHMPAERAASAIALPLAELLLDRAGKGPRGDVALRAEALGLYRRVASRAPLSDPGQTASERIQTVLKGLPRKTRTKLQRPSFEDELRRGKALHRGRRYADAEKLFEELERRAKGDAALACQARLERGRALVYQRKRTEAGVLMREVATGCADPEVKAWARYYGARARLRSGDARGALAECRALVDEHPNHSLADDALYMAATANNDLKDPATKWAVLEELVTKYPGGDMRADARFSLAFEARAQGDHAKALTHFDRLLDEGPRDDAEGIEGRAAYWRARTLLTLGKRAQATEALAALVRAQPLSYHAQQGLMRLRELAPAKAEALLSELRSEARDRQPLTFAWRAEMGEAAFRSALELLRISEVELAKKELTRLGAMGGSTAGDEELVWLGAALLHRARAYASASKLVRKKLHGYRATAPVGRARHLWRIAYPRAFSPLIEEVAAEAKVPAAFVRALAREESAFNPRAVSTAGAYGLIQVMRPTAKAHAKALGLPSTPAALKRPEVNLRIGSRFIHTLWTRYSDNPAVVPAAYNAGHGAVGRWLEARGTQDLDEWIERIPFRETRRYTRRVLQTYGIYAWLDAQELPSLPGTLPTR